MVPLSIHSLKSTGQQHMLWKEKLWGEEKACSKRGEGEKWRKDEGRETKGRALQKVMLTGFEISSGRALVGFSTSVLLGLQPYCCQCFGNSSTEGTKLTRSVRNSPMGLTAHRGLQ